MSMLQQILAEHSKNITDNLSHANEIATENAERKSNTLEERFQHVKDTIEGAGGEMTALSGAYHMGRKVFKKVQQARQAARAIRGTGEDPTTSDIKIDLPEGSSESGGSQSSRPQTTGEEANPEAHTTEDQPTAGESSGDTESVQPEQQEESSSGGGGEEGADTIRDPDTQIGGRGRFQIQEGEVRDAGTGQPQGDLARNVASGEADEAPARVVASEAADVGADEAGTAGEALAKTGADALGRGASALVVNNADTATQAASKLAGVGGDALSAGLDTASAVLDALGPVGEVAGVITSLVGLFEGLGHKKKDVEATGQEASADTPVSTAIDPKALMASTM
jgi:hypothetical protein